MPKQVQRESIEFQQKYKNKDLLVNTRKNIRDEIREAEDIGSKIVSPTGPKGIPLLFEPSFDLAEHLVNNRLSSRRES